MFISSQRNTWKNPCNKMKNAFRRRKKEKGKASVLMAERRKGLSKKIKEFYLTRKKHADFM